MADIKTKFTIKVNGLERCFLTVLEKSNGLDVYFIPTTNEFFGYSQTEGSLQEHRVSFHYSKKSEVYSTIKETVRLLGGLTKTSSALTTCVKDGRGFYSLLTGTCSLMETSRFDLAEGDNACRVCLDDFNPALNCFFYGVFVGPPGVPFVISHSGMRVIECEAGLYRIVIVFGRLMVPSLPYAWLSSSVTFPELLADGGEEIASGRSADECAQTLRSLAAHGISRIYEYIKLSAPREALPAIDAILSSLAPLRPFVVSL